MSHYKDQFTPWREGHKLLSIIDMLVSGGQASVGQSATVADTFIRGLVNTKSIPHSVTTTLKKDGTKDE